MRKTGTNKVLRGLGELEAPPPVLRGTRSGTFGRQSIVRLAVRRSRWHSRTAGDGPLRGTAKGGRPSTALRPAAGRAVGALGGQVCWTLAHQLKQAHLDNCLSPLHLWKVPACRMVSVAGAEFLALP
jgi:hypothetical protein